MGEADADVGAPLRVHQLRFGLSRAENVHDRREGLPVDVDQVHRVGGVLGAIGHDHRDDLPDVARAIPTERPLGRLADVELDDGREAGRHGAEERQRLHPALRSANVRTRTTPGAAAAAVVWMRMMRA